MVVALLVIQQDVALNTARIIVVGDVLIVLMCMASGVVGVRIVHNQHQHQSPQQHYLQGKQQHRI